MIEEYIYELIDISFESSYGLPEDDCIWRVCEDVNKEAEEHTSTIYYDDDGIPLGRSKAEIKMREKVIKEFYAHWISEHQEKKVWNRALNDYILVKYISINETYEKASRTYESTKAVFRLTEILENALLVGEQPAKNNNKNQKSFSKILIMVHERIKLVVGFQTTTRENVQYSITVPNR